MINMGDQKLSKFKYYNQKLFYILKRDFIPDFKSDGPVLTMWLIEFSTLYCFEAQIDSCFDSSQG